MWARGTSLEDSTEGQQPLHPQGAEDRGMASTERGCWGHAGWGVGWTVTGAWGQEGGAPRAERAAGQVDTGVCMESGGESAVL